MWHLNTPQCMLSNTCLISFEHFVIWIGCPLCPSSLFLLSLSSKNIYCKPSFDRAIVMKIIKKGQEMIKTWSMFGDGPMFDDGHVYSNSCNQSHFTTNMGHEHTQLS